MAELQAKGWLLVEDGNHGEYRPRPDEFGSTGATAFIRASDMDSGRVLFESADRINDTALARIRKGVGKGGDILFSHKGTIGKLALVPLDAPPFVCSPQTTSWRVLNPRRLDRQFLYAFMRSDSFTQQWRARKGETDMADYVSLTAQREFWVPVPPIGEQKAIGPILGDVDDKIELNRQMNRTVEAMAQALFKSWFVDLDPVRAKVESRKPGLTEPLVGLFPGRFEHSELGEIPAGWKVASLREVVEINPPRWLCTGELAPYLDMANMPTGSARPLDVVERAVGSGMRFIDGDTLVARITPCLENGKTCFVDFLGCPLRSSN